MSWWQDLLKELNIVVPALTWQPTYEPQSYTSQVMGDGSTVRVPISRTFLATAETAEHLRAIYAPTGKVIEIPFLGAGGPTFENPLVRWIEWPNKVRIIAGLLAAIFSDSYPNDPTTADRMVRDIIVAHGAA